MCELKGREDLKSLRKLARSKEPDSEGRRPHRQTARGRRVSDRATFHSSNPIHTTLPHSGFIPWSRELTNTKHPSFCDTPIIYYPIEPAMVLGTSDLPSPPASSFQSGGGRSAPRRSSSTGDGSLGDPCSCSECGSSDEDPPPALGLELALINGGGKSPSKNNLPVDNSASVLDMHALEAPESRKMKDDSKAHHILEDAMFKPRKRFHRHHRHMLPIETDNDLYRHNIRKNLRHILSHSVHSQHHSQARRRTSHQKLNEEDDKPRKNVSFANMAEAEVTAMGRKPEDKNHKTNTKNDEDVVSHHSGDSEGGITFSVSKVKDGDKTDSSSSPTSADRPITFSPSKKQAPAPTLTETTLPWHNSASNEPVSMQSIVTIYNENEPCPSPGEAVWFDTVPLKEQQIEDPPHTPLENMKFMSESPAVVTETYNIKEEEVPQFSSSPAAAQSHLTPHTGHQHPGGEPDIVNCSMPTGSHDSILPWNHKINDIHEHSGGDALPDLGVAVSHPPTMSPVDVVDGQLSVTTPDDCYLPATWRTSDELVAAPSPSQRHASGDMPDGDAQQIGLPLPWKNNDQVDHYPGSESDTDSAPKSNVLFELGPPSESASARSLPWETSTPGEVVLDMEEDGGEEIMTSDIDQSSMRCLSTDSAPDPDDCLPPPWRSVNVSEASIPVRSPSASHELDSLVPQASHNSLRLSEAESRHSEQFRGHHHVIDIAPRELEHSSSGNALSSMVGDDAEPLDLVSRVQRWLLDTKLDQQDPVPEDLYDTALQDSCAAAALAAADLSDMGECEDTYL